MEGLPANIKKQPRLRVDKNNHFFELYLARHPEMEGLKPADLSAQLERQSKKCIFTDQKLNLRIDLHMEAAVVLKNDQLEPWNSSNVRLVSVYAMRFVIDPGDGRTLDAIAAERRAMEQ